ncbi:unnamed protein product [Spirodela intermedia]|uniref:F-box domain-containing protein n=1 Tax=Spirodela intermedia TaxID=51605 RepID=A0A7I8IQ10_SPIIN|nr:unnamed protein product [Spirodela intermedia]CAA6659664.1 unnamed protein product [Spirodela intermedia]
MTVNYSSHTIFPTASSPAGMPPDGGGFAPSSFFREKDFDWEFLMAPKDCVSGWRSEKSGGGATKMVKSEGVGCGSELPPSPPPTTPAYDDIVDLLPADPFGMGLSADSNTWTAAIAGWIEDLATTVVDRCGYYEYGDYCPHADNLFDYFIYSRSANSAAMDAATSFFPHCAQDCIVGSPLFSSETVLVRQPPLNFSLVGECVEVEPLKFAVEECGRGEDYLVVDHLDSENCSCSGPDSDVTSVPHDALLFALSYLDIPDLLSVERVCKTLCSAVRGDPLLWRHIHIGPPLSKNITDDILSRLTDRTKGSLECLSLVECSQITDSGLRHVLENNPRLKKLNVPACTRLSIEGVVDSLKLFESSAGAGIKSLGVGGLYGINHEHLEVLTRLLRLDQGQEPGARKPLFYHLRHLTSCRHVRVVYDCPVSGCRAQGTDPCRACSICIARCNQCGRCIRDREYEETFALEWVCLSCMNHRPSSSSGQRVMHQRSNPSSEIAAAESSYCSLAGHVG